MIIKTRKTLYFIIWVFLAGCNGDLFVDDYMAKVPNEITLSETNASKDIHFSANNWGLIYIFNEKNGLHTSTSFTTAYTLDGKSATLPFEEKELGVVHYISDYIDVSIEKKSDKKLKITLNENLMNENVEMLVTVGNTYKYESIKVLLAPTQKFQIDSVVYDWNRFSEYKGSLQQVETLRINNEHSSSPITMSFFPFRKSTHDIHFIFQTLPNDIDLFDKLLGTPLPQITIPDVVDGKPVLLETKIPLRVIEQHLPTKLDKEFSVDVTIDEFDKKEVSVFNELTSYSVPYTIYLSNSRTRKKRVFSGELYSKEPVGYYLFKQPFR